MQDKEVFIPQSILQSEDFDAIKSAIFKKFKNSLTNVRTWAAQCLHKYRQDDIYWGPVVTKILIYLATQAQTKDNLIDKILSQSSHFWISRLDNYLNDEVGSDCLFFLYKMNFVTVKAVTQSPSLFAHFARLYNVHDFMNIKYEGFSLVYNFLVENMNSKEALIGIEKLFEVYQSDFKYIISPSLAEIRLLVEKYTSYNTAIINFLKETKLSFPAVDNACICLYRPVIEPYAWYTVKQPAKVSEIQRFLRDISEKKFKKRLELKGKSLLTLTNAGICKQILAEVEWYLVQAYDTAYKLDESAFCLPIGFTPTSQFPLNMLPTEITEAILSEFQTDQLARAIFCLSKGCNQIKRVFDWRRFLKRQFPLKYDMINDTLAENPNFKWNHYCMVQNRLRSNWSQGAFSKLVLPGSPCSMDENLFIGCSKVPRANDTNFESDEFLFFSPNDQEGSFELTEEHVGYYWLNWNDTKDYYKVNFFAPVSDARVCLIDTISELPKIALVFRHYLEIWEGSSMLADVQTPILDPLVRRSVYHNQSLYIGPYKYRLDNNMAREQVLGDHEFVLDIGRKNDLMICGSRLTIKSCSDHQTVASFASPTALASSAVFLDEHKFAANASQVGIIRLFDVRNLGAGATSQIDLHSLKHKFGSLDGPNQRAVSEMDNGIVNVWNLKTCKWTTAFDANQSATEYLINARYLCAGSANDTTNVFDFNNNAKYY